MAWLCHLHQHEPAQHRTLQSSSHCLREPELGKASKAVLGVELWAVRTGINIYEAVSLSVRTPDRFFCPAQCFQISTFTILHQHKIDHPKLVHKLTISMPPQAVAWCFQQTPAHEEDCLMPSPHHSPMSLQPGFVLGFSPLQGIRLLCMLDEASRHLFQTSKCPEISLFCMQLFMYSEFKLLTKKNFI